MSGTVPEPPAAPQIPQLDQGFRAFGAGGLLPPGLEAGSLHRRLFAWQPPAEHVNSQIRMAGNTVLARARWLVRNNGYAKAALRAWRAATVGPTGIRPSSLIEDRATREAVHLAWNDWSNESDVEGLTNIAGIQRRIASEVFMAGEVFVRLRPRLPEDGLSVPLQLQMLPAEQCPLSRIEIAPNGNPIRLGVEFNRNLRDKREAYWFYRINPTDRMSWRQALDAQLLTRVPADEVLHVFDPVEAGQVRGLTSFGAAMVKMFHLDLYDDAELERKKQAARIAAVITASGEANEVVQTDLAQVPIAPFGPGAYMQLNPGEEIKFTDPSEVGSSYEPFQYRTLLAIASALGIPYSELSADLQKTSYASSRAGLIAFRQEVEQFQHSVLVFQCLRRIWVAWMDAAVIAGAVPISPTEYRRNPAMFQRAKPITPKMQWVDPAKDAKAEIDMVNNGFKSRSDVIESLGADPEETDNRIAADRDRAEERDLSFPLVVSRGSSRTDESASQAEGQGQTGDQAGTGDTSTEAAA
jgi:lambda family phage portal protein